MYVMYCNLCMYACVDIICLLICFMFACVTLHTCISIYIYIVFTAVQRTLSPIPQNQRFNINKAVLKGNLGLIVYAPIFRPCLCGVASWVVLLNSQNIMSNFMQNRPLWHIHWYLRYSNIYIYIYSVQSFFNMDTQCKHVKERFVPSVSIITHKVLADVRKRAPTACAASQHISPVPAQSLVEVFARWTCDLSRCFLM